MATIRSAPKKKETIQIALGKKSSHPATIRKEVLTPTPDPAPTPPKWGTQVPRGGGGGGGGGQNTKIHWGIIFGPKKMFLPGVRRLILWCTPTIPKSGGLRHAPLRLIQQPLFNVQT